MVRCARWPSLLEGILDVARLWMEEAREARNPDIFQAPQ